jgi:formiminotetrahydrofolate cyclodeaminase
MALGNMVGSLTLGKKKYADVQDDIIALKAKAGALQQEFFTLTARDAEVFAILARAYGLPKETAAEQAEKTRVMEAALKECSEVPLQIMKRCCEAIELHRDFAAKGTAIAISDVGCGVVCCKAALQAASLNIFINTKMMLDRGFAEDINSQANAMLGEYGQLADDIYINVAARFDS